MVYISGIPATIYIMQEESISVTNPRTDQPSTPLGLQFAYILLLCFVAGFVAFIVYAIYIGSKPSTFTITSLNITETPTPLVAQHRYT